MKALKFMDHKELTDKIYDLIAKTTIELGHRTDGKTMALLAQTFAKDLITENKFRKLFLSDIQTAFHNGVRSADQDFLSIPTFYKWVRKQKSLIDYATYEVHTLNKPKAEVPLYREPPKLITNKK